MRKDVLDRLNNGLMAYVGSKRDASSNIDQNTVKADFFDAVQASINQNELTISSLTAMLKTADLNSLFYYGRKDQGHESSQSAQKVKALYRALGIKIDDHHLRAMLGDGFNFDDFDNFAATQRQHIINKHQRAAGSPSTDAHYQHELKGFLNLNEADNSDKTVAEVLAVRLSHVGVDVTHSLDNYLVELKKFDPSYHDDFIADLGRAMRTSPDYGQFCEAVVRLSVAEGQFDFFQLSPELQASIQNHSLEHGTEACVGIKGAADGRFLDDGDDVNIARFRAAILENKDPLDVVVDGVFDGVDEAPFSAINKEEAIARIDRYVNAKSDDSAKAIFFRGLKGNIIANGLTLAVLQTALTNNQVNLPNIFYKRIGASEGCQAARCMADLFKLSTLQDNDPGMQEMVAGRLPVADDKLRDRQTDLIKRKIKDSIKTPQTAIDTDPVLVQQIGALVGPVVAENNAQLNTVVDRVFARLDDSKFLRVNRDEAIARIEQYVNSKSNDSAKARFFQGLKQDIKNNGLTLAVLQNALTADQGNLPDIFYKRFGENHTSQAARCMADLFQLAAVQPEVDLDMQQMVGGQLPPADPALLDHQEAYIKTQIKACIQAPQDASNTSLVRQINREVDRFKSAAAVLHRDQAYKTATAESIYQKYLIEKGVVQEEGRLSLQGHWLTEVTLGEEDYCNIIIEIHKVLHDDLGGLILDKPTHKENLELLLGLDQAQLTETTYVNLDYDNGENLFELCSEGLEDEQACKNVKDFVKRSRSSIRPLQFEAEMHMRISSRVLERLAGEAISPEQWQGVRNRAAKILEREVDGIFRHAIETARKDDGTIDLVLLNQTIDQQSRALEPFCKEVLIRACSEVGVVLDEDDVNRIRRGLTNPNNAHIFEETTATGFDMLRTDAYHGVSERISATTHTAHDKQLCGSGVSSESQAHRVIHRAGYSIGAEGFNVKPLVGAGVKSRVPSIVVREASHDEAVTDVANKLAASYRRLQAQRGGATGPMSYNLLTSLHTKLYDRTGPEGKNNQQRLSAARILKGSHIFNKRQVELGRMTDLFYVQAIAVNQSTHDLGFAAFDDAVREATLMSEMAMLSTLVDNSAELPSGMATHVKRVYQFAHQSYIDFLKDGAKGNDYFKDSAQGKKLVEVLQRNKPTFMRSEKLIKSSGSVTEMAVGALYRLYSSNRYQEKQFGMLTQALSMFLEAGYEAGCKSANERYGFTAGEEAMIDSLARRVASGSNDFSGSEQGFIDALKAYAAGTTESPAALQIALNKVFAQHNAEGLSPMIACEDQGAASKLDVTSGTTPGVVSGWNRWFGTNNTIPPEASAGAHQHTSKWQPHKAPMKEGGFLGFFADKVSHLAHLGRFVEEFIGDGAVPAPVAVPDLVPVDPDLVAGSQPASVAVGPVPVPASVAVGPVPVPASVGSSPVDRGRSSGDEDADVIAAEAARAAMRTPERYAPKSPGTTAPHAGIFPPGQGGVGQPFSEPQPTAGPVPVSATA